MADGLLNKASIILTPTGYKAGTLYNVAPVVEPYEDFDFARASVASRVNSSGLVEMVGRTLGSELVTNGDFSTSGTPNTSSFTLGWYSNTSNVIIENGSLTMSNSASQSDSRAYATNGVSSNNILTTNKTYELKYDIIENNGVTNFKYYSSSGIFISAPSVEIGSYTIYIKNTSNQLFLFQNSSTNSSIKIDNVSVKEIIDTNNIPRISYDSNGDNGHILLEPTSTNKLPYSEDFSSYTLGSNSTLTYESDVVAPDGSLGVYRLQNPASSSTFLNLVNTTAQSISVWAKAVNPGTNNQFNFYNSSTYSDIQTASSEWQRFKYSWASSLGGTYYINNDGDTFATDIYIWGAQLEELSYPTSYIPTLTGSTETRATETATGAGSADLINSTEGVLYAEIAAFEVQPDFFISMNDGTNNNRVIIKFSDAIDNQLTAFTINSTNASSITHTISNFKQYNKIALSYNSSYLKLFVNGQEVGTSVASPNLPVGLNVLNLSNLLTDKNVKGKLKSLAVFDESLSDSELTQLTT